MRARLLLNLPLVFCAARLLACPLCKETVEKDAAAFGAGFSLSVLVMLGTVFGLAGLLVILFVRAARGAPAVSAADAQAPRAPSASPPARSR